MPFRSLTTVIEKRPSSRAGQNAQMLPMLNERRRYAITWVSQVWTCREKIAFEKRRTKQSGYSHLHCRWLRGPSTQVEYVWALSLAGASWLSARSIKQQGQHIYLPFKNPFIHETQARTSFLVHLYDSERTHEEKTQTLAVMFMAWAKVLWKSGSTLALHAVLWARYYELL